MRIGHGFDIHRFGPGSSVRIGGVDIECERGLIAHSDGDVAVHALIDALLGAAALGDIGRHFPDTDPAWRDVDSRQLLRRVKALLVQAGYCVGNVDVTLIAEQPRFAPHIDAMRDNIATDLEVGVDAVNVKATTNEKLGHIGRGEGIAAHAVALIEPRAS